jgi:hypothetical protein
MYTVLESDHYSVSWLATLFSAAFCCRQHWVENNSHLRSCESGNLSLHTRVFALNQLVSCYLSSFEVIHLCRALGTINFNPFPLFAD